MATSRHKRSAVSEPMIPMHSHTKRILNSVWSQVRRNWPYLALLVCIVLPLLWMAASLAVRSGLFGLSSAPKSNAPSAEQIRLFLTFIGGGLATSAVVLTGLFTREHNARERQRLRLEAVIKSLESLPVGAAPRVAGLFLTLVLLHEERMALRVLQSLWGEDIRKRDLEKEKKVDLEAAMWLIGEVLVGESTQEHHLDGNRANRVAAINEAAALLASHAYELTDERMFYFPGYFLRQWSTEEELPPDAKDSLLQAMARMLVSRSKDWWCPTGGLPEWPTTVWLECAEKERIRWIRSSAAVLIAALHDCFPKQLEDHLSSERLESILKQAAKAMAEHSVPSEYVSVADRIRTDWWA